MFVVIGGDDNASHYKSSCSSLQDTAPGSSQHKCCYRTFSHIERTGVLVRNFEKTPKRYQDPV